MTESSDKAESSKKKPLKKKGPLRLEAIIPLAVFIGLVVLYTVLFLDSHLKAVAEFSLTRIHRAEVNIAEIETSFAKPGIVIKGIQVTDKDMPKRNLFEIGTLGFGVTWDSLLRAKVVIEEAKLQDIQAFSPRKSPGEILPEDISESVFVGDFKKATMAQASQELEGSALGDLLAIATGTDPEAKLQEIRGQLQSEQHIEGLEQRLKQNKEKWESQLKALPDKDELEAKLKKFKIVKLDKDPLKAAKQIKELNREFKELKAQVKSIEASGKELRQEVKSFSHDVKGIDELVKKDLERLQEKIGIPSLDPKSFTKAVFSRYLKERFQGAMKYVSLARKYVPAAKKEKKGEGEEKKVDLQPKPRQEGQVFHFPKVGALPKFWLKRLEVSSKYSGQKLSGDVAGHLNDLSSDPLLTKRPTTFLMAGNFPGLEIYNVDAQGTLAHHLATPVESFQVKVGAWPVGKKIFSESEKLIFGLEQAVGQSTLNLGMKERRVDLMLSNRFKSPKFLIEGDKKVASLLSGALSGVDMVNLNAKAKGNLEQLSWNINSNLGNVLADGLRAQLQAKVANAQAKLERQVNERIGPKKDKFLAEYRKIEGKIGSLLGSKESAAQSVEKQAKQEIDQKVKAAAPEKKIEEKGKKLLKGLKKKWGF